MALVGALVALVVIVVVILASSGSSGSQSGPRSVESMFQDDNLLVYSPTPAVAGTLRVLRGLGVDRVRITVLWLAIAPKPTSRTRPPNFDAANPAAYPAGSWAAYDRIDQMAAASGIKVDFDISAPGPLWAMKRGRATGQAGHALVSVGQRVSAVRDRGGPSLRRADAHVKWSGGATGQLLDDVERAKPAGLAGAAVALGRGHADPGLGADLPQHGRR